MKLLKEVKFKIQSSYEIDAAQFYNEFIKKEDAQNLIRFVSEFGNTLPIPSAILAVGSSVFPSSHWKYIRKLNSKDPDLNASESYNDIDLLIIPEIIVKLSKLETKIEDTLSKMGLLYKNHLNTANGVGYCNAYSVEKNGKYKKIIASFLREDLGMHSITTQLHNGTKLDLIIGRDELLEQTASQKIVEERLKKYAFSLLYRK